jgi:hypothetical protein
MRPTVLLLAGGTSCSILCDSIFDVQSLQGTYAAGTLVEAGWALASVLIGLATLTACRAPGAAEEDAELAHRADLPAFWQALTPYAAVPAVGVLLWGVQARGDSELRPGLLVGAATLASVVLLRQMLDTRETVLQAAQTGRLNQALAEANVRLEARQQRLSALQTISAALVTTCTPGEIGELVMSAGALLLDAQPARCGCAQPTSRRTDAWGVIRDARCDRQGGSQSDRHWVDAREACGRVFGVPGRSCGAPSRCGSSYSGEV